MLVSPEDLPHLKAWLMKQLPEVSDTETDILADYVLALLTSQEGDEDQIRAGCEMELPPFLNPDATSKFTDDLFLVIADKGYLPPELRPRVAKAPPKGLAHQVEPEFAPPTQPRAHKKRAYHETTAADVEMRNGSSPNDRAIKQPRRSGGFGVRTAANDSHYGHGAPSQDPSHKFPPTAFPPGPGNPVQADYSGGFQGAVTASGPGSAVPPSFSSNLPPRPYGPPPTTRKKRQRCRDFDNKGFCARGNSCQYDHGSESIYLPSAPANGPEDFASVDMAAALLSQNFQQLQQLWEAVNSQNEGRSGRGGRKEGGQGSRRRHRKASISADGPVHDRTKTAIVVESIPEDKFSEEAVREFFSQFGNIQEVTLHAYRRVATIKYEDWEAANAAYRSPKVIFDNRFVKVFWYKENAKGGEDANGMGADAADDDAPEEPEFDMDEFLQKQDEAQRQYEEKTRKKQEIEKEREDLEKRQIELIERHREEKQKLQAKLGGPNGSGEEMTSSDALRAQLAALEEEAKLLGLDPNADDASQYGDSVASFRGRGYRGRGRGRGSFPPRGRGSFRGGSRGGRGGRGDVHASYAAYSLDNRPKIVSISGVDFTEPEKDEVLRQHLLGVGEFTDIETSNSGAQITFKDRKMAEKFFFGLSNKEIPGIEGQVELSWVSKPLPPVSAGGVGARDSSIHVHAEDGDDGDEQMADSAEKMDTGDAEASSAQHGASSARGRRVDMDYEVADDDGDWGVE